MERKFSIGLLITFILTGVTLVFSPYSNIGLVIIVLSIVLAYLFVLPFSPIKRGCWSVSDKLVIVNMKYAGFNAKANSRYMSVYTELRPRSNIIVDRIAIKIGRKGIASFDWTPHEVATYESMFVNFKRPNWLCAGEYKAKLIAHTPEGYSKSGEFVLEVTD